MFKFLDGIFNNDNKYHYDAVNKKLREVETMFDELINICDKGADKNMCLLKLDMIKIEVSTLYQLIFEGEYTVNAKYWIKGEQRNGMQLKMLFDYMTCALENAINTKK